MRILLGILSIAMAFLAGIGAHPMVNIGGSDDVPGFFIIQALLFSVIAMGIGLTERRSLR